MTTASTNKKTLLYLDARELPCERMAEIKAALDNGYDVVMASNNIDVFKTFGLKHLITAPLGNYDEAEKIILNYLLHNDVKIAGVLVWKDREVELAARLCLKLNLPCSSLEAAQNVRNKSLTRKNLDKIESVNPNYAVIYCENTFLESFHKIGCPSLLKPAGNSGSRGIFKIKSQNEGLDTYKQFKKYNQSASGDMYTYYSDVVLLEEEVVGTEHSIAGAVVNGEVVVFAIADKKFDRDTLMQYQNIIPSLLPRDIQDDIVCIISQAIKQVAINWCGFHVDFMMTNNGIKILEIGGRLGGELINSHLIPLSQSWLKPYHALMDVVQGKNPFTKNNYIHDVVRRSGARIITPQSTGKIVHIDGLEKVWRHPNTRLFMQMHGVGNDMYLPKDKFKSYEIGYVVAECLLDEDIEEVLSEITSLVSVQVEEKQITASNLG